MLHYTTERDLMRLFSRKNGLIALVLMSFSLILTWAQLSQGATIVGSDAIFHYNRFYDTAMQIKTGHYDYFVSTFGYQQSGRIVNALYGPLFAYAQGLLVLISGNWFTYQLLSRLLLSLLAGSSLYALLRQVKVRTGLALSLALFFLTTFAIQYWTIRQGFSSWGVAFFPFCLLPAIKTAQTKTVNPVKLALVVALMLQVHTLSTLFLVLTYIPFFTYALFSSEKKLRFLTQVGLAISLCLLLTANVWLPLLSLGQANQLIAPFVNKNLPQHTIDRSSRVLLDQPKGLRYLLWGQGLFLFYALKKQGQAVYRLSLIGLTVFLWLASSLFPWDQLAGQGIKLVELIQFPFRFFLIATVLLLICLGQGLAQSAYFYRTKVLLVLLLTGWGAYQNIQNEQKIITQQYWSDTPIQLRKHTQLLGNPDEVRQSLHSQNMKDFLDLAVKSTPDYLPLYHETTANKYKLYENLVISQNQAFSKKRDSQQLVVTWTADDTQPINLPVVIYDGTQLILNGEVLQLTKQELSPIGTPTVTPQVGQNQLTLSYQPKVYLYPAIWLSLMTWPVTLTSLACQTTKKSRYQT